MQVYVLSLDVNHVWFFHLIDPILISPTVDFLLPSSRSLHRNDQKSVLTRERPQVQQGLKCRIQLIPLLFSALFWLYIYALPNPSYRPYNGFRSFSTSLLQYFTPVHSSFSPFYSTPSQRPNKDE